MGYFHRAPVSEARHKAILALAQATAPFRPTVIPHLHRGPRFENIPGNRRSFRRSLPVAMRPPPLALLYIAASAFTASLGRGQTAESSPTSIAPTTPDVALALAPAPDRTRALSPAIAARLAEKMPKFTPANPAEIPPPPSPVLADAKSAPPATPPDLRDLDRPRNTIIRLPNYVVQDEKPPAFKERHLLTPRGHLELAFKRYPGLRFGSLPLLSNNGWALAMLEEDHRLERKAEMEDLVTLVTAPADRAKAKQEVQKTFLRSDW